MSSLLQRLEDELLAGPRRQLAVLIEVSQLPADARAGLEADAGLLRYPLLVQPEFDNLRALGPMLVTTPGGAIGNLQCLADRTPWLRAGMTGWLSSAIPIEELALHLASANRLVCPQGESYLLRYHAPHVLEALHGMQNTWSQAFFAPLVSWWALQSGGGWRRYAGAANPRSATLFPLRPDEALWKALLAEDPEPHALASMLGKLDPPVFPTACPGERLQRVQALLKEADAHGLQRTQDRQDYGLLRLRAGDAALDSGRLVRAIEHSRSSGMRLLDAWMQG